MSHSSRSLVLALLLLSTTCQYVQAATFVDIRYDDHRIVFTPTTGWDSWNENFTKSVVCAGVWTNTPSERRTISLSFTGNGIRVYGFADTPRWTPPARATFQLGDEPLEYLEILPQTTCNLVKGRKDLKEGNHQVVVTPLTASFVLTSFSVVVGPDDEVVPGSVSGCFQRVPSMLLLLFICSVFCSLLSF